MKCSRHFAFVTCIVLHCASGEALAQYPPPPTAPAHGYSPSGARAYVSLRYPTFHIGALPPLCMGTYSGPGDQFYGGICLPLRMRFMRKLGVALDPSYISYSYGTNTFGMFGLRPGLQFSILEGRGAHVASTLYLLGGVDLWIPTTSLDKTPSVFWGGHGAFGILFTEVRGIGGGMELRGMVRRGFGNQENALAQEMSSVRFGFEVRFLTIYASF